MPFIPDPTQQQIIDITSGNHLVLAPPGCGKTQILAERLHLALEQGVKPEDMLCLTFTNRAARGMRERINERVGDEMAKDVFVGNVHRFCSRYLFSNNIVPAESAIIDDDTIISILARYLGEDEEKVAANNRRKHAYMQIMFYSHFMYDIEQDNPKEMRMHSECVTREDIALMKALCKKQDKAFDASAMIDIYNHADYYLDFIKQPGFLPVTRDIAEQSLKKMLYAHAYTAYKKLNNLLDFEDLLQLTYTNLKSDKDHKRYSWLQVDEVQDLNMLQLAIIFELQLSASPFYGEGVSLFLGDEQQAIFSFMGAKLTTLNYLKEKCKGNIHHLNINHRAPRLFVEMLNTYAENNLNADSAFLPTAANMGEGCAITGKGYILPFENIRDEFNSVAKRASGLTSNYPSETTAIIVNSNHDADEVSKALEQAKSQHFKISGTDLFSTPEVKLLFAHLSVLENDHNFLAWSRILEGMKVCGTAYSARQFVHRLRKFSITPSELIDERNTLLKRFSDTFSTEDIVVFDTETTGLNVFDDDIIQIAAERIRQGKSVEKFSVYIETDKEIPAMLGDIENPIIEERKHQKLYSHAEALQMFLDFIGDSPLLAHNASFDWHIMLYNLRRYLPTADWKGRKAECFDSLRIIRQLRPDLHAFKLKILLKELGLEGENSHLADDDVNATVSLVNYCYERTNEILPLQEKYLNRKDVKEKAGRLRRNYGEYYQHGMKQLYVREKSNSGMPALVEELLYFYNCLKDMRLIQSIDKIDYISRYLSKDVIDEEKEPSLIEQLDNHIMEINTFKEADLCGSSTMEDKLFVSTIHKAKGLEFDNVFVFDVVDGRIPSYYNENNPSMLQEDARKLYVAMSRAKKRLFICWSKDAPYSGAPKRKLSRFMEPIKKYFKQ